MEANRHVVNRISTNASRVNLQGIGATNSTRLHDMSVIPTLATDAVFLTPAHPRAFSPPSHSSTVPPRLLRARPIVSDPDMSILSVPIDMFVLRTRTFH